MGVGPKIHHRSNLIASLTGLDEDEITKVSGENINTTRHYSDLRIQHISGRELSKNDYLQFFTV